MCHDFTSYTCCVEIVNTLVQRVAKLILNRNLILLRVVTLDNNVIYAVK